MSLNIEAGSALRQRWEFVLQRLRGDLDSAAVSDFDPAFVPYETDGTGAQFLNPTGSLPEWRFQEMDDQCDTVRVVGGDVLLAGFVIDGHGVIRLVGPLAGVLVVGYFLLRRERRSWWPIFLYPVAAGIVLLISWPYLWESPIMRFIEVLRHMANNPQILPVLFEGQVLASNQLPWVYMPTLMLYTMTEPAVILFIAGFGVVLFNLLRRKID